MGVKPTADGRWYGLVVLGFTAAALNTGANLLLAMAGGALGVFVINVWLARRAIRLLHVELHGPTHAEQGRPVWLQVELSNSAGRECSASVAVRSEWSPTLQGVAGVPADLTATASLRLEAALSRGKHVLEGVELLCAAPFGLAEARVRSVARHELTVTPRIYPVRAQVLQRRTRGEGSAPAALLRGAEQRDRVRSLREFRGGDSPRAIHWRSSARRGQLVVREFERGLPDRALVLVELPPGNPRLVDALLSLAGSLHTALRARGERVGLGLAGAEAVYVPPEASRGQVLDALAEAQPAGPGTGALAGALRQVGSAPTRTWFVTHASQTSVPGATRLVLRDPADLDRWLVRSQRESAQRAEVLA